MRQTDKRYQRTEHTIESVLQKAIKQNPNTICLRPSKIIHDAHISPSTFYRHHKNLDLALRRQDNRIFKKFSRHFYYAQKYHPSLNYNLELFLKYFFDHSEYFDLVFKRHNTEIVFRFFKLLQAQIYEQCNLSETSSKTFKLLFFEVYSLLENWSKNNFNADEINVIKRDILSLIQTIDKRASLLDKN